MAGRPTAAEMHQKEELVHAILGRKADATNEQIQDVIQKRLKVGITEETIQKFRETFKSGASFRDGDTKELGHKNGVANGAQMQSVHVTKERRNGKAVEPEQDAGEEPVEQYTLDAAMEELKAPLGAVRDILGKCPELRAVGLAKTSKGIEPFRKIRIEKQEGFSID